jgi:hypothetical protein
MRPGLFDRLKSFAKFETNGRYIAVSSHGGKRGVSPDARLQFKCVTRLNQYWLKFDLNFMSGRPGGAATGR